MFSWDDSPDLNITPLVDVMLVLMAILMVTAPTITFQEQIALPQGSKTVQVVKPKTLTIRMDKDQKIYLGKDTYALDTFADDAEYYNIIAFIIRLPIFTSSGYSLHSGR